MLGRPDHRGIVTASILVASFVMGAAPKHDQVVPVIRSAGLAIQPLHTVKRPTKPGEWLEKHPEPGQSFAQYLTTNPNRPNEQRTTLYIQPLGDFDPEQRRLLGATDELLRVFYGVPVKKLERIDLEVFPAQSRRVHPTGGQHQILTRSILELLEKQRPDDAVAVLALTTSWAEKGVRSRCLVSSACLAGGTSIAVPVAPPSEPANRRCHTVVLAASSCATNLPRPRSLGG